jgi:hypothetical protein
MSSACAAVVVEADILRQLLQRWGKVVEDDRMLVRDLKERRGLES